MHKLLPVICTKSVFLQHLPLSGEPNHSLPLPNVHFSTRPEQPSEKTITLKTITLKTITLKTITLNTITLTTMQSTDLQRQRPESMALPDAASHMKLQLQCGICGVLLAIGDSCLGCKLFCRVPENKETRAD